MEICEVLTMKTECLVSVVIPAYNAENSIKKCLNAVMSQTYKNIEVIVVDDGSHDDTFNVCSKYVDKDSRIRVIRQNNGGPSKARNHGIAEATGDYIVFWDSDDYPEPDLIASYLNAWEKWKDKAVSFLLCGMSFDNEFNKRVNDQKIVLEVGLGYVEGENYLMPRSNAAMLAFLKLFNFVTNKCYDLNKIKDNEIKFDEKIKVGEDLKFNLDYLDKCVGNIGMINRALYHYVKRSGDSLSVSYHEGDLEDTKTIYRRFINWQKNQLDATYDNVMVIKGIYIFNWVIRLTAMYEALKKTENARKVKWMIHKELCCKEFRQTLCEVRKAKKISVLRFACLRTGYFEVFYFFRALYQIIKG